MVEKAKQFTRMRKWIATPRWISTAPHKVPEEAEGKKKKQPTQCYLQMGSTHCKAFGLEKPDLKLVAVWMEK